MRLEIIECTLVFLAPIFIATLINNFSRKETRANLKVVYYKFFILCATLFIASQIPIAINDGSSLGLVVRILGNVLMALLVFEFFLIPAKDTHPDDIAIIHNFVLWLVAFIFISVCCVQHYPNIAKDAEWKLHPFKDIIKISKKVYKDCAMPSDSVENLPICNLFSCVKHLTPKSTA